MRPLFLSRRRRLWPVFIVTLAEAIVTVAACVVIGALAAAGF